MGPWKRTKSWIWQISDPKREAYWFNAQQSDTLLFYIQKDAESPWFPGKWSTNEWGKPTSMETFGGYMSSVQNPKCNCTEYWLQNGISTSSSPVVASLNDSWSIISTFYTNHQNEEIQYKGRISEGCFTKLGRKDDASPTRRRCEMAKSMRLLMMTRWYIKDHRWENNADQKGDGAAILSSFIEWADQLSAVCLKTKRAIIHFNIT